MEKEEVYTPSSDIEIHGHVRGTGQDVFGRENNHQIKYKTLTWPLVAVLMITEIVRHKNPPQRSQHSWSI